jgi:hypothetical protein
MTIQGQVMANHNKNSDEQDPKFSFGTRELREARRAATLADAQDPRKPKNADTGGGFDPYNTSGSFDRRKHWERVGRR